MKAIQTSKKYYILLTLCLLSACVAMQLRGQSVNPHRDTVIHVSTQKTSLVVFPYAVEAADMGSPDILVKPIQTGSNILKVKAARTDFTPTNLSVVTRDGQLYTITVLYDSLVAGQVYRLGGQLPTPPETVPLKMALPELEEAARTAVNQPATKNHYPMRKYRMVFRFRQVLFRKDQLFFVFRVSNFSRVPYDVHFIRCYQHDRQRTKRSSQTEKELHPVYRYVSSGDRINGNDTAALVLVFDKFTIADHKKMVVELYEKNGDRVMRLPVSGNSILRANTW